MDKLVAREFFTEKIEKLIHDQDLPFSIAVADIDNFTDINVAHGYAMGDLVIAKVVSILRQNISDGDLISRSGDEFSVLLIDKGAERSFMYMEEIRKFLSSNNFQLGDEIKKDIHINISCGIASFPRDAKNTIELLRMADSSMYRAKKLGKNRVCLSEPDSLVLKSCHFTKTQNERLAELSKEMEKTESFLVREAIDDLLKKYRH
ncbi:MAG: diguanylate cyclase [Christensenellales bacterium]